MERKKGLGLKEVACKKLIPKLIKDTNEQWRLLNGNYPRPRIKGALLSNMGIKRYNDLIEWESCFFLMLEDTCQKNISRQRKYSIKLNRHYHHDGNITLFPSCKNTIVKRSDSGEGYIIETQLPSTYDCSEKVIGRFSSSKMNSYGNMKSNLFGTYFQELYKKINEYNKVIREVNEFVNLHVSNVESYWFHYATRIGDKPSETITKQLI